MNNNRKLYHLVYATGMPQSSVDHLSVIRNFSLLTPNFPEAEAILGRTLKDAGEIKQGTMDLLEMGVKAVLIKGGYSRNERFVQDFYANRDGKNYGSPASDFEDIAAELAALWRRR